MKTLDKTKIDNEIKMLNLLETDALLVKIVNMFDVQEWRV
jgi:hypothetical protein